MSGRGVILTYHALEDGPSPLCVSPDLFAEHVECLLEADAALLTVSELAGSVRTGRIPPRAVALAFDDAFASAVDVAGPLLAERGLTATFFCVAGFLGRRNDWPSQRPGAHRAPLAAADDLFELGQCGFELASHGIQHAPCDELDEAHLASELRQSRELLEQAVGGPVRSFAYPYGARPQPAARWRVEEVYDAACGTRLGTVSAASDPYELERVDAYYVRRPELLARLVEGSLGPYLAARRVGAGAKRAFRKDYAGFRAE